MASPRQFCSYSNELRNVLRTVLQSDYYSRFDWEHLINNLLQMSELLKVERDVRGMGNSRMSQPQPYDNSWRVWYVDDPHVERPLVKTDDSAVGFYALNSECLVKFIADETKERIYEVLETIREQNACRGSARLG